MKIKILSFLVVYLLFWSTFTLHAQSYTSKKGILILGSDKISTLTERVNAGFHLFQIEKPMDYIIVSGGCNAHHSNICESQMMKNLLIEKGIPSEMIFEEGESKNTIQNYCFSRRLLDDEGTRLIQPHDTLFIVSNHWHAIPVAARFSKYDKVIAKYYIVGNLVPNQEDKVNYTGIMSDLDSECYCNPKRK